jgi:hypothetical protein
MTALPALTAVTRPLPASTDATLLSPLTQIIRCSEASPGKTSALRM